MSAEKQDMTPIDSMSMGRVDEKGIAARFDFSLSHVLSEAWHKVKGFKAPLWGGVGYYALALIAIAVVLILLKTIFIHTIGMGNIAHNVLGIVRLVGQCLVFPMVIGISMLGVYRAIEVPVHAKNVFDFYTHFWSLIGVLIALYIVIFLCAFLGTLFIVVALNTHPHLIVSVLIFALGLLFAGVGLYLMISYTFAALLVAEKGFGVWRALECSRKAVTQHWFKVFFTHLCLVIVLIVSTAVFLVGLIWTLPWAVATWGILYRTLFGVEKVLLK